MWDVGDFAGYDTVPLACDDLTQLERALIISALSVLQSRDAWFEMDQLTWDSLEAVLANIVDRVSYVA